MDTPLFPAALDPWASQEPPRSVDWESALAHAQAVMDPHDPREQTRFRIVERSVALLASTPSMSSLTLALNPTADRITGWADTAHGVLNLEEGQASGSAFRALERASKDVFRMLQVLPAGERRELLSEIFQAPLTLENAGFGLNVSLDGLNTRTASIVPVEQSLRQPRP